MDRDTGIKHWFFFFLIQFLILNIASIAETFFTGVSDWVEILPAFVLLLWYIMCSFTEVFPTGVQSYCRFLLLMVLVVVMLSVAGFVIGVNISDWVNFEGFGKAIGQILSLNQ